MTNKLKLPKLFRKKELTKFQRFGLFFYDRTKTTSILWVSLVIFGLLSYSVLMQRQGFPNVEVPISVTSGTYFVNDSKKVDEDVTGPLSQIAIKQVNVKKVTSTSGANFFSVVVEYKDGVRASEGLAQLRSSAIDAKILPKSASIDYKTLNGSKFNNQYDAMLSVAMSTDTSVTELNQLANNLKAEFVKTNGVLDVVVLEQNKSGLNPVTSQKVTLQKNFDLVGESINGKATFYRAVELGIIAKPGTDMIRLEHQLGNKISELNKNPTYRGAIVRISAGVAENIQTQISNLQTNLLEGLLVVIIISLLLISWRAGIATAISMASVLLITVGLLYVCGLTLNTITLFALVLCLGLIVDDTTIMAEVIDANKRANASNRDIVATAMKRVARASTAGTLVTMLAFSPMLFISGILGSFIRILPITIIISLAVSLIVSLTLIPFFSRSLLLSKRSKKSKSSSPIIRAENWISTQLSDLVLVGRTNRRKIVVIGLVAMLISTSFLFGSLVYFKKLKFDIFPASKDSNDLIMNINYYPNTSITKSEQIAVDADTVVANSLGSNFHALNYLNSGTDSSATATIKLVDFKQREAKSPKLLSDLNAEFANFKDARVKVSQGDVGPPKDDMPFRVQVFGDDKVRTAKLAADIASFLQGRSVKRTSNSTTATVIRTAIKGDVGQVIRSDGKKLIEVQAGFSADDTSALVSSAQKAVESEFTDQRISSYGVSPSDVRFDFGNETNNQNSFKSMLFAFPVLLVIMYILLMIQFGSLLQPLLIFTAIPFSFFGVAAGLYYTNNPLSFFVMIGFFALIGIAVNNTILLVDFANQSRHAGHDVYESMAMAVKARFRPLITTSLTSVVALVPLALSDPFWESLAFTLIFGLLSSTFLVVVSFPYFYLLADFMRSRFSRRKFFAWTGVLIVTVVAAELVYVRALPIVVLLVAAAAITKWLQGKILKYLHRHN